MLEFQLVQGEEFFKIFESHIWSSFLGNEGMVVLDYKETELKKIKKFFEGTMDTAENYIKSALKMLVK